MRLRSLHALTFVLLLVALAACQPAPNITQVLPPDGTLRVGDTVEITGTFVGVAAANAIVEVGGVPAVVTGQTFALDVDLEPGANSVLVELRDATNAAVRKRVRVALVRGETLPADDFAEDAVGLRFNESFFEALPTRAIAEAAVAGFVEDNEFFQGGLGADLIECLLDAAATLDADVSDELGMRLTIFPDCQDLEGMHTFDTPFGSATCRLRMTLGGSAWVEGDLEPHAEVPEKLEFDGAADASFDPEYDIDDPGDNGFCDFVPNPLGGLAQLALNFFANDVLVDLAEKAADVVQLDAVQSFCFIEDGCAPEEEAGLRFRGALEAVDEIDAAVLVRGDARTQPLNVAPLPSLRVSDALPIFGATTADGNRPYDLGLALTPTAINQLLAAATAEGALNIDYTPLMSEGEKAFLMALIHEDLTNVSIRFEATVPPVLTGSLVCAGGLSLPKFQLANARVLVETDLGALGVVPLMIMALDVEAGARLRPADDPEDGMGLGVELVIGPSCPETGVEAVMLQNPTVWPDTPFLDFVVMKALESDLAGALGTLPIEQMIGIDGIDGEPLATLGFQVVELANPPSSFNVYLNLLVDGEGGSDDPLVLLESDFDSGDEGWTYLLGSLTSPTTGGPGGSGDRHLLGVPNSESFTSYFVAPAKFRGDWTGYDSLEVDLRSSGGSYYDSDFGYHGDVSLANGPLTAQYDLGRRPTVAWDHFSISLGGGAGWTLGGGAESLADVLENVTEFQIRGEYGFGADQTSLDNVQLVLD